MRRILIGHCGIAAAALGVLLSGAPGQAKKVTAPEIVMSDNFRASLQAARAAIKAGDVTTAGNRVGSLYPATDFEQYAAAGARFEYAVMRRDVQAQRIALTDMFKTSAVPRTDAPRLRFVAAYLSFQVGNYDDALAQLDYARTLGYDEIDALLLRADIHLRKGKSQDARSYVTQALARQRQAGASIPAAWYDRAISLAYQTGDWAGLGALYRERLATYPSRGEWRTALVNYIAGSGMDAQGQLDLYRLQAANGAMASERDYQAYAALAEKAGYAAEAKAIIEAGRAAGKLTSAHVPSVKLLKTVTPRATKEIAGLPAQAKKATAAGNGEAAMALADMHFSLSQFPQAAEYYQLALTKGGVDSSRVHARLGIALARSGDLPGARQALAQTDGNWGTVAGFWSTWVDEQSRKSGTALASAAGSIG